MKNNLKLKSVIAFSFVLFLMPFLQTCSDKTIQNSLCSQAKKAPLEVVSKKHENAPTADKVAPYKNTKECESCIDRARKENTYNFYELSWMAYDEFQSRLLTDQSFYTSLNFTVILLLTFVMLVLTFKRKFKVIILLTVINLILLIVTTSYLCWMGVIEQFNQIRYGYYLFVVNSILIIIQSRNEKRLQNGFEKV